MVCDCEFIYIYIYMVRFMAARVQDGFVSVMCTQDDATWHNLDH